MTQRNVTDTKPLNSLTLKLKNLNDQVIVITGATSGIGLVTARMAAEKGAKLVLAGTEEDALKTLTDELKNQGTEVVYVVTDVSKKEDVDRLAEETIKEYGGFDTWVNNAAVAIYGHITDVPIEDARQLFEVNYWGTVYGSLAALDHFKDKETAGALINLGSVVGNRTFPIQGTYSSSKFAVHSLTDALRMEAEKDHIPVVVSQIHPARVDTPYGDHAASYIDKAPSHDAMMYPPESVAEAILHVAQNPTRDMFVGGQSKMIALMGAIMPRFTDYFLEKSVYKTNYDESRDAGSPKESTLHGQAEEMHERGQNSGWRRKGSWMVKAKKHPLLFWLPIVGLFLTIFTLLLPSSYKKKKMHKAKKMMHMKKAKAMVKHPKATFKAEKAMWKHPKAAMKAEKAMM